MYNSSSGGGEEFFPSGQNSPHSVESLAPTSSPQPLLYRGYPGAITAATKGRQIQIDCWPRYVLPKTPDDLLEHQLIGQKKPEDIDRGCLAVASSAEDGAENILDEWLSMTGIFDADRCSSRLDFSIF